MRNIYNSFVKLKKKRSFPNLRRAELHLTDRCNLGCYFCNQADLRKKRLSELPYNVIVETLEQMRTIGLREVRLSGGGEPTLHPSFKKIIEYLYSRDITLRDLTTNGVLCDRPIIDLLCSGRWLAVEFSLHAVDVKDWTSITLGSRKDFQRTIDNIRYLAEKKRSSKSPCPRIILQIGIDERTYKKLFKSYEMACDLGVDHLTFITYNFITYPRNVLSAGDKILDQLRAIKADARLRKRKMLVSYGLSNIKLNISAVQDAVISGSGNEIVCIEDYCSPCFMPWHGVTIKANGDVVACCAGFVPSIMGNIYDAPIKSIWLGSKYRDLRSRFEKVLRAKNIDMTNLPIHISCTPFARPDEGCPVKIRWEDLVKFHSIRDPAGAMKGGYQ